jgi:hypothetical protein
MNLASFCGLIVVLCGAGFVLERRLIEIRDALRDIARKLEKPE